MNIIKKYKPSLLLIYDNVLECETKKPKKSKPVNFLLNKKFNVIRNFIYFYSIFLLILPFTSYKDKNNEEFRIILNPYSLLLLDEDYNSYFLIYT